MYLSCCVWALTASPADVISDMGSLGFRWIDIRPDFAPPEEMKTLAERQSLGVSSVAASFGVPKGASLDSSDKKTRGRALAHVEQAVRDCAALGGDVVYMVPGPDGSRSALRGYADSLVRIADFAAENDVRVCIEHFPGTALPTAAATLGYLDSIGHPNLGLLFDIGHVQISGEEPAAVLRDAGERLFYVHLDDNDGKGDLHWGLLDGVLTKETLRGTFEALMAIGYSGAISLELNPGLTDPFQALRRSRQIVIECGSEFMLEY